MLLLASTLNYSKLILLTLQVYFSLIFQLSLLLWWSTQVSYFHFHFHFVDLLELHIFSFTFFAWASYFQVRGPQPQPVDLFAWPRIYPTEEACGVEAYQQQDFQGWLFVCWFLVREPVKLRLTKSKMFAMLRKLQRTNVWHYLVSALSWSIKALKINHLPKGVKWNLWRPEDNHHPLPEKELHRGTWRECLHRPCQSGGTRPWPGRTKLTVQDQTWSTKTFFRTGSAQWTRAHSLAYNTCGCSTWTIMIWPR